MKSHFDVLDRGLSVRELSLRWGVDKQTVRKLIERGELEAMKLGGKVVVLAEDWKTFENKCKSQNWSEDQTPHIGASDIIRKEKENSFRRGVRMKNALSSS